MGGFFGGGGGGSSVDLASPPAIGNTTPNTGAFTTLSANNGTITTSSPAFTLAQTWNAGAQTFTALRVNATDTASASGSLLIDLQVGGVSKFNVDKTGSIIASYGINIGGATTNAPLLTSGTFYLASATVVQWGTGANRLVTDLAVLKESSNILSQRNSTNAQTFRLYNTFTDASNYERGFFRWNANVLEIGAEAAGTGTNRTVRISTYDTIDFRNTQYGYSVGSVSNGLWVLNNGPQITNVCRMEANYGFQLTSTKTLGWVSGTNMALAPDTALYRNAAGVLEVNSGTAGTFRDLIVRNFRMSAPTGVPTANNSTGTEGSIRWDADYIYICTATNTWKRVAISTWP